MFLRLLLMGKKRNARRAKQGKGWKQRIKEAEKKGTAEKRRSREAKKHKSRKTQKHRKAGKQRKAEKTEKNKESRESKEKQRKEENRRSREAKRQRVREKQKRREAGNKKSKKTSLNGKNKVIPLEHSPLYPSFTYLSFGDHYRRVNRPTDAPTCSSSVQSFCRVGIVFWGFSPPREETHLVVLDYHHHHHRHRHVWHQPDRYGIIRVYLRLVGLVSTRVNYPSPRFSQIYCSYLLPGTQIQCQHCIHRLTYIHIHTVCNTNKYINIYICIIFI